MIKLVTYGSQLFAAERAETHSGCGVKLGFSADWSGLIKSIDLRNEKSRVRRILSAEMPVVRIPHELTDGGGAISCCVIGRDRSGSIVLRTNCLKL